MKTIKIITSFALFFCFVPTSFALMDLSEKAVVYITTQCLKQEFIKVDQVAHGKCNEYNYQGFVHNPFFSEKYVSVEIECKNTYRGFKLELGLKTGKLRGEKIDENRTLLRWFYVPVIHSSKIVEKNDQKYWTNITLWNNEKANFEMDAYLKDEDDRRLTNKNNTPIWFDIKKYENCLQKKAVSYFENIDSL